MCGYNVKVAPPGQFVHPDAVKQLNALANNYVGPRSFEDLRDDAWAAEMDTKYAKTFPVGEEFPDNWIGRA